MMLILLRKKWILIYLPPKAKWALVASYPHAHSLIAAWHFIASRHYQWQKCCEANTNTKQEQASNKELDMVIMEYHLCLLVRCVQLLWFNVCHTFPRQMLVFHVSESGGRIFCDPPISKGNENYDDDMNGLLKGLIKYPRPFYCTHCGRSIRHCIYASHIFSTVPISYQVAYVRFYASVSILKVSLSWSIDGAQKSYIHSNSM